MKSLSEQEKEQAIQLLNRIVRVPIDPDSIDTPEQACDRAVALVEAKRLLGYEPDFDEDEAQKYFWLMRKICNRRIEDNNRRFNLPN